VNTIDFALTPPTERLPRKKVRSVSKQVYAELRDSDRLAKSTHLVLTALAAYYNRFAVWPTTRELVQYMFDRGQLPAPSANLISGRITFLVDGIDRKSKDGHVTHVGGGVCEFLQTRRCRISGRPAAPVRIRERGSLE
jgi:hypothetical protein